MAKVIKKKHLTKKATHDACVALISYVLNEVKTWRGSDAWGFADQSYDYIVCPNCEGHLVLKYHPM